nr:hypothetical protein CFP56_58168 [Quercus suber]
MCFRRRGRRWCCGDSEVRSEKEGRRLEEALVSDIARQRKACGKVDEYSRPVRRKRRHYSREPGNLDSTSGELSGDVTRCRHSEWTASAKTVAGMNRQIQLDSRSQVMESCALKIGGPADDQGYLFFQSGWTNPKSVAAVRSSPHKQTTLSHARLAVILQSART